MRPIVPVQQLSRRLPTAGRLRMGVQKRTQRGKSYPAAIDTWRLTSEDEQAIRQVAEAYGGTPRPWSDAPSAGQWEVITEAAELRIVLPPDPLGGSPGYELWSAGGCQRRCDGVTATVTVAGPEGGEPAEVDCICAAQERMACEVKTRLSVILPDVKFSGVWRLDSGSWDAAHELPGMVEMIQALQRRGMARALLAIEHRTRVAQGKDGKSQTRKFVVPSLRIGGSPDQLAAGEASLGLTAGEVRRAEIGAGEVEQPPDEDGGVIDVEPVVPEVAETDDAAPATAPPARGRIDGQEVRKLVIACNEAAEKLMVSADAFRHDLIHLLTEGRTESSREIDEGEARHLRTVLSLFDSGRLQVAGALGPDERYMFLTADGEKLAFEGARPSLPAEATGAAPPPSPPAEAVVWRDVAKRAGVTEGKVLMVAREVAGQVGVEAPSVLRDVESGSALERATLERLGVPT